MIPGPSLSIAAGTTRAGKRERGQAYGELGKTAFELVERRGL
jgi:hypothetical protein